MYDTFPSLLAEAAPMFDRMMPQDIIPVIAITLGDRRRRPRLR